MKDLGALEGPNKLHTANYIMGCKLVAMKQVKGLYLKGGIP